MAKDVSIYYLVVYIPPHATQTHYVHKVEHETKELMIKEKT